MKEIDALSYGQHEANGKACVMEAAAYIAGDPWCFRPKCVSPVITQFMIGWNDGIPDNESRTRLLTPLIPVILGTNGSAESEIKRSWMASDWLVRKCAPAFMNLTPVLKLHAKALLDLELIYDKSRLDAAIPIIKKAQMASNAARDAARDVGWSAVWVAAGDAARDVSWVAARDAARDAARAAARAAAYNSAWVAAHNAAYNAAWVAACDAAHNAACDATWAAACDAAHNATCGVAWADAWAVAYDAAWAAVWAELAPTVLALQESATDLVKRMAAVERTEFKIQRSLKINDLEFVATL